jgi:putative ABC transport system permease protein
MGYDLKYAWLALRHRRIATLAAVLCLAVGVGANAALFGVVDALMLRPPAGVAQPDELVRLGIGAPGGPAGWGAGRSATYPQVMQAREQLALVAEVAGYAPRQLTLGSGATAEPFQGVIVTANYFHVLGVAPRAGRFFAAEDDVAGAPAAAVLSHAAWQRRFGGDAGVIGRTIELNGVTATVIGVAPRGFVGVDLGTPDVWLPMGVAQFENFRGPNQYTERVYWLQVLARRGAEVSAEALEQVASGATRDRYAASVLMPLSTAPLRAMFFAEQRGENPVPAWVLGITLAVLLLSCATVANLLLAQGSARQREIAVRLALGASRRRILRQLLLENLLIALAAAVAATVLAAWSNGLLQVLPVPPIERLVELRVTAFAFGVALLTTLLFGLAPAVWTARGDLQAVLRQAGHGGRSQLSAQGGLVVAQIALSFTLLVGAGLFVGSFRNMQRIDTGFDLQRLITASVELRGRGLTQRETGDFHERALERLRRLPEVEAATMGNIVPFYMMSRSGFHIPDGRSDDDQPLPVLVNAVGSDYFRTFGMSVADGRTFDARDAAGSPPVAMVSAALAREHWGGASPVGSCIRLSNRHGETCVAIIGVARDVNFQEVRGEPSQVLFLLAAQQPGGAGGGTIFIRARGGSDIIARVRGEIQALEAGLPFVHVQPLDERARPQRVQWEVAATVFTAFGALAALLAAVGLCMVVSFMVMQRRRELGIRVALGATRGGVIAHVLGRAARITAAGIAIGAVIALTGARLLASALYGVSPADVATFATVAALLSGVALAASYLPARAAARVDPMGVLREE